MLVLDHYSIAIALVEDTPEAFLRAGQIDGSVCQEMDPHLYLMMALATISSLAQHLVMSSSGAKLLYGVEELTAMLETAIWAFVKAIEISE